MPCALLAAAPRLRLPAWLVAGALLPLLWHLAGAVCPQLDGDDISQACCPRQRSQDPSPGRRGGKDGSRHRKGGQTLGLGHGARSLSLPWGLRPKPASGPLVPGTSWGKMLGLSPMEQGIIPAAGPPRCLLQVQPVGEEALRLSFGRDGGPRATGVLGGTI